MLNIELEVEIFDIISGMNDADIRNNTNFPTHIFREISGDERTLNLDNNIQEWPTDISEMPFITLEGIQKYFVTDLDQDEKPRGAYKHKISGKLKCSWLYLNLSTQIYFE